MLGLTVLRRWPMTGKETGDEKRDRSVWFDLGGGAFLALERLLTRRSRWPALLADRTHGYLMIALRITLAARPDWEARLAAAGVAVVDRTPYTLYLVDPGGEPGRPLALAGRGARADVADLAGGANERLSLPSITYLPAGTRVDCAAGESVFEVARRAGIKVTTACVGKATCGLCRVKVVAGEQHLSPFNSRRAQAPRQRLLHQQAAPLLPGAARGEGDVVVELPAARDCQADRLTG